MALQVTRVEQAMGNGLRRLYRLPKLTTAPSKATGVSAKEQAAKEGITMLRVARLMRQTAAILTLSGVLTLIQATYLAITQDWSKIFDALGMIDDFTISYWLMVGAAAFEAITNTKNQDDIDYTETILKPMESLLGERPPAAVDSRAHARLRVPDGRPCRDWRGPGPLRGRAGAGRRAGQERPVRHVRSLSTRRSTRRGPRGCACSMA